MTATLLLLTLSALPAGDAAQPTAEQLQYFESKVRPVLAEHCEKCHGEKKQWAGFRLDSREGLLKGGDLGPAIVPGKPAESRLIRAIQQTDDEVSMPPEDKLSDQQIADLVRWVEMGAPYPVAEATAVTRHRDPEHWSFQPPADQPLPNVENTAWLQSPVDNFILAKLEAANLSPARPAEKRTLIRRVTFDLTGLPPTPDAIEAFLADNRPDAYARLVDRLLASPAYGQRWGRHWLDVARYADSNGLDENVAHGNAWRYRDYVVSAMNRDRPYDQFIIEQLAGDLLTAQSQDQRHEQLIATGFLAMGPKVLAEVDEHKMQMDIVDEQIDTLGRAFIGLTLGCARCHDHKFDPIDTADYYGLAGIFKSSRAMENYKKVARWHEHVLPSPESDSFKAQYDAEVAAKKQAVEEFMAKADEQVRQTATAGASLPAKLESLYPKETKDELKKLRDELTNLQKTPPDLPSAMGMVEDKVVDAAIHIRGNPQKLGDVAPRHVPPAVRVPQAPQFTTAESGRRELAQWLIDPQHPLTSRVMVNRIWRWHFGAGLVRTTDNFGLLGDDPSHPELLDWLANGFVADGWALKSIHRLIVGSSTYQQSSAPSAAALTADPENRLFGRANVKRLEAEAVRDALLAVGDTLDGQMGGSLLEVKNRGYFFDHTSKDLTQYTSHRRSLYLPVVRNNVYDLFQLLDFPDPAIPTGDRTTTTIAPQALLALNSELIMECAAGLVTRALADESDDARRVSRLIEIAYGRPAIAKEVEANLAFLSQVEQAMTGDEPDGDKRRREAWNVVAQVIVAANEFVYVN